MRLISSKWFVLSLSNATEHLRETHSSRFIIARNEIAIIIMCQCRIVGYLSALCSAVKSHHLLRLFVDSSQTTPSSRHSFGYRGLKRGRITRVTCALEMGLLDIFDLKLTKQVKRGCDIMRLS